MKRGFSLVELSIVLVIIGLLTGGILGGQALIKASKLQAQLKDFDAIATAHHAFSDKYACIAGDCRDVASYFPSIANGNGDGMVDCWPSSGTNECATYFQALEGAGLIAQRRTSMGATAYEYRQGLLGEQSLTYIHYQDRYAGGGYTPATLLGSGAAWINFVNFNSPWANGPALRPEDSLNLDTKIDDGKPFSGKYLSVAGAIPAGTYRTDCTNSSQEYMLSVPDVSCRSFVKIQ